MPIDLQHQAMGYDRTATMFSPEGHLLQVEYAEKAVRLGNASIGIKCVNGVFIITDKRVKDKLIVAKSASKINEIDSHIIVSAAGITADARVLVEKAQVLAQQHRITYDSPIEPELVIKELSNMKQQFTQYGGARPFGVSILLAGVNEAQAELFMSDITGNYFSYHANAIGENDEKIKEKLREHYRKDMALKEGVKLALKIFEEIKDKNFNVDDFELVYIKAEKNKDAKLQRIEGKEIKENMEKL